MIKHSGILFLLLILSVSPAFAVDFEHDVYGQVQSFTWKEYNNGRRLLKESGPIYAVGYAGKYIFSDLITVRPRGELFGGEVDYDGQTQTGIPAKSDTSYVGIKTEGDIGVRFRMSEGFAMEPFAGLGWRAWERDIDDTVVFNGTSFVPVGGATELWSIFYARLGLRADLIANERLKFFAEGVAKVALYNWEEAQDVCIRACPACITICQDVDLEPGKKTSYYAELGMKALRFKAALFYESLRFSESDVEPLGGGFGVLQPKSEADMYGLNMGWSF